MVVESLERSHSPQEGESNVVKGPWRGPAYLDPDRADFFLPRYVNELGEPIRVYATARCTALIWEIYRTGLPKRDWPHLLLGWDGEPVWQDAAGLKPAASLDPAKIAEIASNKGVFVYNFRRKRAWRPVWYPSIGLEDRLPGNMSYETVELFGYKSFIEGWENRPKAKIFKND